VRILVQCAASVTLHLVEITNEIFTNGRLPQKPVPQLPVTPNNPPWNSWIALLVWLSSVAVVVIFPVLIVGAYVVPMRARFAGQQALIEFIKTDPTAVVLQIIAIIPAHLITMVLAWAIVTRFRTYDFRKTLGWTSGGMRWWHHILIFAGIFALSAVAVSISPEADNDLLRMLRSSRAAALLVALIATLSAPIVEEIIYRGILYSAFQRAYGAWPAVAFVTFLFAAVHFPQYWPSYSTLFLLTVLSLVLTLIRVWTGNLLPCIIFHTIFNGLQSIGLIAEPYFTTPDPATVNSVAFQFL